jgi:hypothetical protein
MNASGESGDESGVICSSDVVDAAVDIVVVGEELFEDEADVDTLPCDLCRGASVKDLKWSISFTGEQPVISVSNGEVKAGMVESLPDCD